MSTTPSSTLSAAALAADAPHHAEGAEAECLSDIGNSIWIDEGVPGGHNNVELSHNAIQDAGEVGVTYIDVTLQGAGADGRFDTQDDTFRVTATDANGKYLFTDVPNGAYKVLVDLPRQYRVTRANVGSDITDSDLQTKNLLVNGSFESGDAEGVSSIPGWTGVGDTVEVHSAEYFGVTGQDGTYALELDASPDKFGTGVSQTVRTQPGRFYDISYSLARREGTEESSNAVEVYWNGKLVHSSSPMHTDMGVFPVAIRVFGTSEPSTLEFRQPANTPSDGVGVIIDNVSLVEIGTQ